MWIGNAFLLVINLPLIGIWVKLLNVPYRLMFSAILLFCAIGIYSINNDASDVLLTALFGLVGYVFIKFGFEPAPLLLGFVLGRLMEEKLRQALILSRGNFSVFINEPVSAVLLFISLAIVVLAVLPSVRKKKEEALAGAD
jgi:putative tricarboxylic transport membrane protein